MIQVQPFNIEILSTHKSFFLLDHIPKNITEVDIWIQTPVGYESVDFVDIFCMNDGSLIAAWEHPLQKLGLQNLVAFAEGKTQILNLYPIERILDIYDKPVDSNLGTFNFVASQAIEGGDWRCDRGHYGAKAFAGEVSGRVIKSLEHIVMYESFMSVAGVGHLIYLESSDPENNELAYEKLNNSLIPSTGRTIQEVIRLIYEWSVLADEPFNSSDDAAIAAKEYINALMFSDEEIELIKQLPPMQVSNFITGSTQARIRPENIPNISADIANILFRRMASSSLTFIVSRNPEIWDYEEVLEKELEELENGISRFRTYYAVPDSVDLEDTVRVLHHADNKAPNQSSYIHNQLRHFKNKKIIIDKVVNNEI